MKIGLFGGSFNPVHNRHIEIVNFLINKKIVDNVWIIPCGNHAFDKKLLDAKHRIEMISLSFKDRRVKIDKTEISSKEKSYTIETIRKIKNKFPKYKFYFIIGSDILKSFDKWYKSKELASEIEFILFERRGHTTNPRHLKIYKKVKENISNISSTKIRNLIKQKGNVSNNVPKEVEDYILKNKLYLD